MCTKALHHLEQDLEQILLVVAVFTEGLYTDRIHAQRMVLHLLLRFNLGAVEIVPKAEEVALAAVVEVFEDILLVLPSFVTADEVNHLQEMYVCGRLMGV